MKHRITPSAHRPGAISRFGLLLSIFLSTLAQADIYIHEDDNGRKYITDHPMPALKLLSVVRDGRPVQPATPTAEKTRPRPSKSARPADFPRVDPTTQRQRDDMRSQLLREELKTEEALLTQARSGKNAEAQSVHTKNIEMLKKELQHVK